MDTKPLKELSAAEVITLLHNVDLGQYEETFNKERFNGRDLCEFEEVQDFIDMGVNKFKAKSFFKRLMEFKEVGVPHSLLIPPITALPSPSASTNQEVSTLSISSSLPPTPPPTSSSSSLQIEAVSTAAVTSTREYYLPPPSSSSYQIEAVSTASVTSELDFAAERIPEPEPEAIRVEPFDLLPKHNRNCMLLSTACYQPDERTAMGLLNQNGHSLTHIKLHDGKENGLFIIAKDGEDTYLAIRGSILAADWQTNFQAWSKVKSVAAVHHGFYCRALQMPIGYLTDLLATGSGNVIITGHSLGGAVATLVTANLLQNFSGRNSINDPKHRIRCVTYGAPLVFADGAAMTDMLIGHHFTHYIYEDDIVPKIFTILQDMQDSYNETNIDASWISSLFSLSQSATVLGVALKVAPAVISKVIDSTIAKYCPMGYYRMIMRETFAIQDVGRSQREQCLAVKPKEFGFQSIQCNHSMENYLRALTNSEPAIQGLRNSVDALIFPDPLVTGIQIYHAGAGKLNVTIQGSNLFLVKQVTSDLGICKLHESTPDDTFPSLSSTSLTLSADIIPGGRVETRELVNIDATTLFSSRPQCIGNVHPTVINRHELDDNVLQDLITATVMLMSFAGDKRHLPVFDSTRDYLLEIFRSVRADLFFQFGNPLLEHMLEVMPVETIQALAQSGKLTQYKQHLAACKETNLSMSSAFKMVEMAKDKSFWESLFEVPNAIPKDVTILDMLINCRARREKLTLPMDPATSPHELLDALLEPLTLRYLVSAENNIAEAMKHAKDNRTETENFLEAFGGNLGMCVTQVCLVSDVIGKYFNKDQKERGTVPTYLHQILAMQYVQGGLKAVGASAVLSVGAYVYMLGMLANPPVVGALTALASAAALATNYSDPFGMATSASGLRRGLYNGIVPTDQAMPPPGTLSIHHEEGMLCEAITRFPHPDGAPTVAMSPVDRYISYFFHKGSPIIDHFDGGRRTKLTVLSYHLREQLKALPMVIFNGPSGHGKSTLLAYSVSATGTDPDFTSFGSKAKQRTMLPSISVVHAQHTRAHHFAKFKGWTPHVFHEREFLFLVLDTVGEKTVGGQSSLSPIAAAAAGALSAHSPTRQPTKTVHEALSEMFQKLHRLLNVFVAVEVIVFKVDATANYAADSLSLTSDRSRFGIAVSKPTLTCFTYADEASDRFTDSVEDFLAEGNTRFGMLGRNIDTRPIGYPLLTENMLPRMWAYLPPRDHFSGHRDARSFLETGLPNGYGNVVLLPADIREWVCQACTFVRNSFDT